MNNINKILNHKSIDKKFLKWLELEDEDIDCEYPLAVTSMCEYACLFLGMLFYKTDIINNLYLYYGKMNIDIISAEHFWISYKGKDDEIFIDLTIAQFHKQLPHLFHVSKNQAHILGYSWASEGTSLKDYIDEAEGFKFYVNPVNFKEPPIKINDYLNTENKAIEELKINMGKIHEGLTERV